MTENQDNTGTQRPHRPIRSYVLRQGRLTKGQQKAFELSWPQFGIQFNQRPIDLSLAFGNDQPVFLEIGFGNGDSLIQMAQHAPEHNFLGIEVHGPGVGHLLMEIRERQINNIRIIQHDALEVLEQAIQANSLAGCYLFFPDPWHKKKHHKRRIMQERLLNLLASRIQPGGFFHAATDWKDYAVQMMAELTAHPGFKNRMQDNTYSPRPDERPVTRFEQRGHRLGHDVWDMVFDRT